MSQTLSVAFLICVAARRTRLKTLLRIRGHEIYFSLQLTAAKVRREMVARS
jgi:hypothetical protein